MIDKESLQFLQDQFIAAASPALQSSPNGVPYLVLPGNVTTHSVERFLSAPVRFRGEFTTHRVSDFAAYVQENQGGAEAKIFVDPEAISATAIFGLGSHASPGWGEHQAILSPKALPPFSWLLSSAYDGLKRNHTFTQLEFLDFMADWKSFLSYRDEDGAEIFYPVAVKAVRSIAVQTKQQADSTVGNISSSRASLESIDVKARGDCALPESFVFSCKPYDEFRDRQFECSLRAIIKEGAPPRLAYRIVGLDATKLEIADEFVEKLTDTFHAYEMGGLAESIFVGAFRNGQ